MKQTAKARPPPLPKRKRGKPATVYLRCIETGEVDLLVNFAATWARATGRSENYGRWCLYQAARGVGYLYGDSGRNGAFGLHWERIHLPL